MASEAENLCTEILQIFAGASSKYESNYEAIRSLDKEQSDILHEIELADIQDEERGYSLYVTVRDIRRQRRIIKDENELLFPLVELLKANEPFHQKLCKVNGRIKEIERLQESRIYHARVRDDLTICADDDDMEEVMANEDT